MNILVKIMNNVSKIKDSSKKFPDSFKLLIDTYTIKNNVKFYFFCIHFLRLKNDLEPIYFNKEEIQDIYIKTKRHLNAFNRFAIIYKLKKYKHFEYYTDLNFISLKNYEDKDKIKIIQNKTIYNFKLKDLINLWKICLKNNDQMFPLPKELKNPFTNIIFEKHHLYNIFFKYVFSGNLMPEIIVYYFKSNFNLHLFKMEAHETLQTNAITKYVEKGPVQEQFDYLSMLMHEFRKYTEYTFLKPDLSIFKKLCVIKKLKKFIKYYLIYKFNTNILKKEFYYKIIKEEIKNQVSLVRENVFIQLTEDEIIRYDNERTSQNQPEDSISDIEDDDEEENNINEQILLPRNSGLAINNSTAVAFSLNRITGTSISRRSSYPRYLPPIVTNTYNNNNSTNPFVSTHEIPRTPTNRGTTNIIQSFNLGIR